MKYEKPTIEIMTIEAEDVLTASSESYEVEDNNDGSGGIIFDASNIFR